MKTSNYPEWPVLLIDDEEPFLLSAGFTLNSLGINNVVECSDSQEARSLLARQSFSVVFLDINMPHVSGIELLQFIQQNHPDLPVIMLTAVNEVETAVRCMKEGAFDYLVKPVDDNALLTAVRRAIEYWRLRNENTLLKKQLLAGGLENPQAFSEIITRSESMQGIFRYLEAVGPTRLPLLIFGETGTGKELIARAVHQLSGRPGEFVAVNVAGLDDTLFSDTLFGHRKGAFSGAVQDRRGLIEQAAGGTLFLDEIGDLSLESQVKLLRLLQEGSYYPLGSDAPGISDARIVVATNVELKRRTQEGGFRQDLYYRLQAHQINLPPLRERREDITLLINHFLDRAAGELNKKRPTAPPELYTLLRNYRFPGNIRELEGLIFDAVSRHKAGVLSIQTIREKLQPEFVDDQPASADEPPADGIRFPLVLPTLKNMEQMLIEEALARADNNQSIAANLLGISRRALNNRLQRRGK